MSIKKAPSNNDLHRRALNMAKSFFLPATYDVHYLALAERLGLNILKRELGRFKI